MPRAKGNSAKPSEPLSSVGGVRRIQKSDEWGGFVQVSIDNAHREEFDIWAMEAGEGVWRELDDALGSGLKFTMAFDGANQCYIASLTGRPDFAGVRPFTCCLSARGGTFAEAITVLMSKHCAILHYDWWEAVNEPKKARYTFG